MELINLGSLHRANVPKMFEHPDRDSERNLRLTYHQGALFSVVAIFNIFTDLALVVLPVYMMSTVQLPQTQKSLIMGVFSIRLL